MNLNFKNFILLAILMKLAISCGGKNSADSLTSVQKEGVFHILSKESDKCLKFEPELETNLRQENCNGSDQQQFNIENNNGEHTISPLTSPELCLGKKDNQFSFQPCDDSTKTRIDIKESLNDSLFVKFKIKNSLTCIDIYQQKHDDSAHFHEWECLKDNPSQDFFLSKPIIPENKKILPRIIWTFWDGGLSKLPNFYKANLKNWEKVLNSNVDKSEQFEIRVINNSHNKNDKNHYSKHIDEKLIPSIEEIKGKISKEDKENGLNPSVVLSDFVRLEVLKIHGGFWMDPSVILHQNFDDFIGILENIEPFDILGYTSRKQASHNLRYVDSFENFFIATFSGIPVLKEWGRNFKKYWELRDPGMSAEENPLFNGHEGHTINIDRFRLLKDYLNQHTTLRYTLLKDDKLNNSNGKFKKNFYISGDISGKENGPFSMLEKVGWEEEVEVLAKIEKGEPTNLLVDKNKDEFTTLLSELSNVKMSKFPSKNSKFIMFEDYAESKKQDIKPKHRPESFYNDKSNIFGYINTLE